MQVKYKHFALYRLLFSLKFLSSYDSIVSSHIIAESSKVLTKYFPFSQLHIAGFQHNLFQIHDVF